MVSSSSCSSKKDSATEEGGGRRLIFLPSSLVEQLHLLDVLDHNGDMEMLDLKMEQWELLKYVEEVLSGSETPIDMVTPGSETIKADIVDVKGYKVFLYHDRHDGEMETLDLKMEKWELLKDGEEIISGSEAPIDTVTPGSEPIKAALVAVMGYKIKASTAGTLESIFSKYEHEEDGRCFNAL